MINENSESLNRKKRIKQRREKVNEILYYSIDPGRNNILTVIQFKLNANGSVSIVRKFKLTKKQYYVISGALKHTYEMKQVSNQEDVINATEFLKTHTTWIGLNRQDSIQWFQAQSVLQSSFGTYEHSELDFNRERMTQHSIDRWVFKHFTMTEDGKRVDARNVVIFYGSAKFKSTGKFEKFGGSPTKSILEAIQRQFQTVLIDEYLTTQMCGVCEHKTKQMFHEVAGKLKPIRDYRQCDGICKRILDRDYNACLNIAKASIGWRMEGETKVISGRPNYLRNDKVIRLQQSDIRLSTHPTEPQGLVVS